MTATGANCDPSHYHLSSELLQYIDTVLSAGTLTPKTYSQHSGYSDPFKTGHITSFLRSKPWINIKPFTMTLHDLLSALL